MEHFSLWWRIGNALISYVAYLGQFFYPLGLAAFYPPPGLDLPTWKIGGAFLILLGITATACLWRRRCPYLLVGWLWYLGMLVPVIGLVKVGIGAMADRFTYLPQIGLCMALIWAAADLLHGWRFRHWACGIASALVLAALTGCAWRQTSFWRDSETLWNHTLACTSRNREAHNHLGLALADRGRIGEAMAQYQKALKIAPDYVRAYNNLAWLLATCPAATLRNGVEAIEHAQRANQLTGGRQPAILDTLAAAYAEAGRFPEAVATAHKALALATQQGKQTLAKALRTRTALYEAGEPYHQPLSACAPVKP
jgi:tetratricopeptide (TPR) repeat protein